VLQVSERKKSSKDKASFPGTLGGHFEEFVDELFLTPNVGPAHPSNLSLPQHVDHFITLNRSSRGLELSESLLGVHPSFDGAVV
jgi:hypothetical protein